MTLFSSVVNGISLVGNAAFDGWQLWQFGKKVECIGCSQAVDVRQHNGLCLQLAEQIGRIKAAATNDEKGRKELTEEVLCTFDRYEEKETLSQLELAGWKSKIQFEQ